MSASPIHPSTTSPTTSSAVRFNLTVHGGTPPYAFTWNFADGGASTNATPTHTFRAGGTYKVSVGIADRVGGLIHRTLTVVVPSPPSSPSVLAWLSHGVGLYTFSAALAAVAFLLAVVIMGRKRRREAAADETESSGPEPTGPDTPPTQPRGRSPPPSPPAR
jgi:hypothetical protein